jgi:hypothetical protein
MMELQKPQNRQNSNQTLRYLPTTLLIGTGYYIFSIQMKKPDWRSMKMSSAKNFACVSVTVTL